MCIRIIGANIIGGVFWGLAGIVLALPLVAMLKLIFDNMDALKPVGALMSNDVHKNENVFFDQWDDDQYRLFGILDDQEQG